MHPFHLRIGKVHCCPTGICYRCFIAVRKFNKHTSRNKIFINPFYCGLVFADYYEYFNKVSRCSLVFDIPKSKLGCDSALKELVYLGTKSAKKELYNETYQPKHVNPVNWWNR